MNYLLVGGVAVALLCGVVASFFLWSVWREWRLSVAVRLLEEARRDFAESIVPAQQAFQKELNIARQGSEFSIAYDDKAVELVSEANRRYTMACAPSQAVYNNREKVVNRILARYGRNGRPQ